MLFRRFEIKQTEHRHPIYFIFFIRKKARCSNFKQTILLNRLPTSFIIAFTLQTVISLINFQSSTEILSGFPIPNVRPSTPLNSPSVPFQVENYSFVSHFLFYTLVSIWGPIFLDFTTSHADDKGAWQKPFQQILAIPFPTPTPLRHNHHRMQPF